jgi:sortase A
MKLVVARKPLTQVLRWTQRVLFAFAAVALGYCMFVLVDGWVFQAREHRRLEQLLRDRQSAMSESVQTASAVSPKSPPPPGIGELIGSLDIPRLGLSVIVVEGVGKGDLRHAAGHIPGTPLPGQPGNAAISAHRDTFFRPLRNIRQDDTITVTTLLGTYRYRVASITIVSPSDGSILAPSGTESLTLVTCYPFYFVGPAPERYIVRAWRVA